MMVRAGGVVVLLAIGVLASACSSAADVVVGDGDVPLQADGDELDDGLAEYHWLIGTAWNVRAIDDEPLVEPLVGGATLTFHRTPPTGMVLEKESSFIVLTIVQGCEFPIVLFSSGEKFTIQPGPGDDCGPQTVLEALTTQNPSGEVMIELEDDVLKLSTGSLTITAEHFQSTSIQQDVATPAITEPGPGAAEMATNLVGTTWTIDEMIGFPSDNVVRGDLRFGEDVASYTPCNGAHHNLVWEDGGYRESPTEDYATTLRACGEYMQFGALSDVGDFVAVEFPEPGRMVLRRGDYVVTATRS